MNTASKLFHHTRRRFLGMLGAMGTLLPWPASASRKSRLSRHEASFYRKAPRPGAGTEKP